MQDHSMKFQQAKSLLAQATGKTGDECYALLKDQQGQVNETLVGLILEAQQSMHIAIKSLITSETPEA